MAGPSLAGYSLAFDDEFDGTAVDTSKWQNLFPWGDSHLAGETERYQTFSQSPSTYQVAGGALTITAAPSSGGLYTSGRISSQNDSFNFQPGTYIEARMKLPAPDNTGAWPAFWTAAKSQVWPPEYDTMEWVKSLGGTGMNFGQVSNVWNSSDMHGGPVYNLPFNVTAGYHTYGVQWTTNNQMIEYIDGQQMATGNVPADWFDSSGKAIPQYVEANLAVGSNQSPADWAGPPNGQTMTMQTDYIRGFAVTGTQPAVTPQAASSPDGGGLNYYGADNAPGAAPPPPPPPPTTAHDDTLVLHMADDPFQGDAQGQVLVDGKAFGSPLTVTTHRDWWGPTQEFDLNIAAVPSGTHTIGVEFINDLSTSTQDRNLYVNPIQIGTASSSGVVNTKTYGSGTQALYSTGDTASFPGVVIQH